jgi:serine/threonine protein kinase
MSLYKNLLLENRYKIESDEPLAKGGMGLVYTAIDIVLDTKVAVKVILPEKEHKTRLIKEFKQEAKRQSKLYHEGIPQIKDFFIHNNSYCLVMDFIEGDDLSTKIKSKVPTLEVILDWADQILDILEYIHSQGVTHRDIKPSNIKLTPRNRIKLLDFGIARGTIGDMTLVDTKTLAAVSVPYASIEQILKRKDWQDTISAVSKRHKDKVEEIIKIETNESDDIFSFGATFYEILTAQKPHQASLRAISVWGNQEDSIKNVFDLSSKLPSEIADIFMKCLSLEGINRPKSAKDVRLMLNQAKDLLLQKENESVITSKVEELRLSIQDDFKKQTNEIETNHQIKLNNEKTILAQKHKAERATLVQNSKKEFDEANKSWEQKLNSKITELNANWTKAHNDLTTSTEKKHLSLIGQKDFIIGQLSLEKSTAIKDIELIQIDYKSIKTDLEILKNNNVQLTKSKSALEQQLALSGKKFGCLPILFGLILSTVFGYAAIPFIANKFQESKKPVANSNSNISTNANITNTNSNNLAKQTPISTPTPIPTPAPVYDIPEIQANITDVKFYESGDNYVADDKRVYATKFSTRKTRYVNVELRLSNGISSSENKDIKLTLYWYSPNRQLAKKCTETFQISDSATNSGETYDSGCGNKDYNNQEIGKHKVVVKYGKKILKSAEFTVY